MCANYEPVTQTDRLISYFGVHRDRRERGPSEAVEAWPLSLAPFIRLAEDGSGNRVCEDGVFGLLPAFAAEMAYGRKTYNARSETVHSKPSFRDAWLYGRRCIIPAEVLYEQSYAPGKAVRVGVRPATGEPMGIAGVYHAWTGPDGKTRGTFAMLTVNADGHPLYSRLGPPAKEKRMVVILKPEDYGRWLSCTPAEAREYFRQWEGKLETFDKPLPPR
jgi:putative SOS response-associated peptidase YedK